METFHEALRAYIVDGDEKAGLRAAQIWLDADEGRAAFATALRRELAPDRISVPGSLAFGRLSSGKGFWVFVAQQGARTVTVYAHVRDLPGRPPYALALVPAVARATRSALMPPRAAPRAGTAGGSGASRAPGGRSPSASRAATTSTGSSARRP